MDKKICMIAGANSEIGIEIAKSLMLEYSLILIWHEHNQNIKENMEDMQNVTFIQADLCQEEKVEEIIKKTYLRFGQLDLLVNCIGKNVKVRGEELDHIIWDSVLSANLKPALFLGRYYAKYKPDGQAGCIINFASTAGIRGIPVSPHYIVSKAGVIALSEYYAKVLAPDIRVNVIAPGFVETTNHRAPSYEKIKESIPMKRMARLSEISETVKYLADCKYITGQTIVVDGGMIL